MKTKTLKFAFFISSALFVFTSIAAQTGYTEIYPNYRVEISNERLDVNQYNSKFKGSMLDYTETRHDGTQIQVKSYQKNSNFEVYERPAHPAIHTVYKEFYADGRLKQKGVLLPYQVKIGKWIRCDNRGNCSITDHENRPDTYGYNKILQYLESEGIYHKTGGTTWKCTFWYTPASYTWGVRIDKNGKQYKMLNFDSRGEREIREYDLTEYTNKVPVYKSFNQ
ncbi:hypothetical protein [Prevotella sp. 10(H)]|uniref:hypothetical protein n=1 Tax=Prevotella sp. 10(H) TaxID=1158294 RepID=UPI0012DDF90A|nr:hypothetical protein [Prevotella sp. 10(H)]